MAVNKRLTNVTSCGRLAGHGPTVKRQPSDRPSPFGGAGGLSGERPPLEEMTDGELDIYAEVMYARGMLHFEAVLAVAPRPVRRRRPSDYKAKNCEEARGGRP